MGKEAFTIIPDRVLLSDELRSVTVHARWLFVVMLTRWRRGKAGQTRPFPFTYKELRTETGMKRHTISSCFKQLVRIHAIAKLPGGLMCNKNQFIINWKWLEVYHSKAAGTIAARPIDWTEELETSLMNQNTLGAEAALALHVDVDSFA